MKGIVEELLEGLPEGRDEIEDYDVGIRYVAVKLGSGRCGVAYRPPEAAFPERSEVVGEDALRAARWALSSDLGRRALGIATINALTELSGPVRYGDPLDELDARDKVIAMVGYFHPVERRFSGVAKEIRVVEREEVIRGRGLPNAFPPEKAGEALRGADIVVITGSALVYGGMEEYLELGRGASEVLVLGPTSSMNPKPFFRRGATIVGGVEIADPQALFSSPKECRDLFASAARKIYFKRSDWAL